MKRREARIFKALGHPSRLRLVELLAGGPRCVCELVRKVPGRQATISRHLAVLVAAGILTRRRVGVKMIYTLSMPCLLDVMACARRGRCRGRNRR